MSLKHKNTSKWAKKQQTYAKYDDKAREQVQEQLELSKKLTKKLKQFEVGSDSDEEAGVNGDSTARDALEQQRTAAVAAAIEKIKPTLVDNPWMKMMSGVGGTAPQNGENQKNANGEDDEFQIKNLKPLRNEEMLTNEDDEEIEKNEKSSKKRKENGHGQVKEKKNEVADAVAPKTEKSSEEKPSFRHQDDSEDEPESFKTTDAASSKNSAKSRYEKKRDENEHRLTLMEAFADDDIVEEFKTEKVKIRVRIKNLGDSFNCLSFLFV